MTTNEEWRSIAQGYEVSNFGRVRSWTVARRQRRVAPKVLKPYAIRTGYLRVCINRRDVLVHSLVMQAFVGPCPDGHEINHVDCDKSNNAVSNLEYVTHLDNMRHARKSGWVPCLRLQNKLSIAQVLSIYIDPRTTREIANEYGVYTSTIRDIKTRRTWRRTIDEAESALVNMRRST